MEADAGHKQENSLANQRPAGGQAASGALEKQEERNKLPEVSEVFERLIYFSFGGGVYKTPAGKSCSGQTLNVFILCISAP